VDAALRDGSLKFILHGEKLKGKWALIRMGGKAANGIKPNWLLIKEHDQFERGPSEPAITEQAEKSVVAKRTLEEIAGSRDHVWNLRGAGQRAVKPAALKVSSQRPDPMSHKARNSQKQEDYGVDAYPTEQLPAFVPPHLAMQATAASSAAGWLHELKLDGYRIQAVRQGTKVQLKTRTGLDWTGLDWTQRMPAIAESVAALTAEQVVLDGEVVVLAEDGTTSFADL
jgi:bifunctional non-homologous end joining protein LigD